MYLIKKLIMKRLPKTSFVRHYFMKKKIFNNTWTLIDYCKYFNCKFKVHLSFLYVGHTHEDIDAAFSVVAAKTSQSRCRGFWMLVEFCTVCTTLRAGSVPALINIITIQNLYTLDFNTLMEIKHLCHTGKTAKDHGKQFFKTCWPQFQEVHQKSSYHLISTISTFPANETTLKNTDISFQTSLFINGGWNCN